MRGTLDRHRSAAVLVGGLDGLLREAQVAQDLEAWIIQLGFGEAQHVPAERLAKGEPVEDILDVEGGRQRCLDLGQHLVREALSA